MPTVEIEETVRTRVRKTVSEDTTIAIPKKGGEKNEEQI